MKYFYVALCCLSSYISLAQHVVRGKIIADSIAFTQVNIVNFTQKTGTVNNDKGEFKLRANIGDSLIFSSVQYQPYTLKVTEKMLIDKENHIYLFPEVNQLEAVKLSNLNLTGDLVADSKKIKTLPYWGTGRKPLSYGEHILNVIKKSGTVFGGSRKTYARIEAILEFEAKLNKIRRALPNRFYTEQLHLPKEYIEDFLYFCTKDVTFNAVIKKNNPLVFIDFLKKNKKRYLKFKGWQEK